ncbi:MAG: hypothetical protein IPN71_17375 [Fibrobacteres bacterium]|nr:hypothetical protein [Fibrobacterota bacterium]
MISTQTKAIFAALVAASATPSWSALFAPVGAAAPKEAKKAASVFADDWLDLDEKMDGPTKAQLKLDDAVVGSFFIDEIPTGGPFSYVYGGKTVSKEVPSSTSGNKGIFATYIDNDWSGVSLSVGVSKFLDIAPYRKTGTLTFWIKAGPDSKKFFIGLLDNQGKDASGNDKKVQTKVVGDGYVVFKDGEWSQVRIPLKAFIDDGVYWDAKAGKEVPSKVDWSKIQEFRLSIGRDENKVGKGKPVIFYLDQIQVTKTALGIYDPDAYWDSFKSDVADLVVDDFSRTAGAWKSANGTTASIKVAVGDFPKPPPAGLSGKSIKVDFKPGDWYDFFVRAEDAKGLATDYSKHYAMSFWLYTDKSYQSIDVTIQDKGAEYFITKVGATRGWNQVLVPFRNFSKFPYYQPPQAVQNNKLDLDGVVQLGFKPGGDIPGTLWVGGIKVTNAREIKKDAAPAELAAIFQANPAKSVQAIPDIYGVNVGLWAPELIEAASLSVQKSMALGVVRYPGGLRSDEEDWKKTIEKKDFHVDTDEFLDWALQAGVKPMFTANVGDGTPAMAAEWVKYVNKTRTKGPKVQLWEIGNEVYGNWHKYYDKWGKDGGVAYGKAVREFVKAMKAADPTIKITAVWMLNGTWNKEVFKQVADVVDGVNVHHYAQGANSENDLGVLAVSSEADELMRDVRKQVEELGVKGKKYEIWLTEWNSVDFNPGPQILSHVEGVFVADYLGHLAQSPIQVANLWALYNGRDKRMGDYGMLSTSADPQGQNAKRPAYFAFGMLANALTGTLLDGKSNQENLSSWISKRADGKTSIVFVNKSAETDFKTTLKVPGLKGEATVSILTKENSGGLKTQEATGATYDQSGPSVEKKSVKDGDVITVPKHAILTIVFK